MNERIKNHINMLFEKAPQTQRAFELKEELQANSEERYQDLIAGGMVEEDAIKSVIHSIGNVTELFGDLEEISQKEFEVSNAYYKKAAMIKAVAVGLYLLSVAVWIFFLFVDNMVNTPAIPGLPVFDHFDYNMFGFILMIVIAIIPTCMLVYVLSLAPKYKKQENTVVEDFKEWKSASQKSKSIKGAVSAVLWSACICLYFAISFLTYAWYATWIIFLVAICLQTVIELVFRMKQHQEGE